jgi:hypothetical protein
MLVTGGVPTGIWPSVSLRPGGGVAVPGKPPAPLTAIEPDPLHGKPVIGFVPVALPPMAEVVPGKVPGLMGDIGGSGISGRLNGLVGFCAKTSGGLAPALGKCRNAKPFAWLIVANAPVPTIVTAATAVRASVYAYRARIRPSPAHPNDTSIEDATSKPLLQSVPHRSESAADPGAREFHAMSVARTHICHDEATEHS